MVAPTPQTLSPFAVLSLVYCFVSGWGVVRGVQLRWDVKKDIAAKALDPRPDPVGVELIANDLRRETWRLAKQAAVAIALWLPLVVHPVLRDGPDRAFFELHRAALAFVSMGLLFNSYADLRLRRKYHRGMILRRLDDPPRP